jgi:probable phosphoglycerate mutase
MLAQTAYWFLRHGETDWNVTSRTQGNVEVPLNVNGIAQANTAARALMGRGIGTIVASTLGRARQTAAIVGEALGMDFSTDPGLREASFGTREGDAMGAWFEDWVNGLYVPPGGESFAEVRVRVVAAANRVLGLPGPVLIVAHGGMFRALRAEMGLSAAVRTANGVPLRCEPGAPAWKITPAPLEM